MEDNYKPNPDFDEWVKTHDEKLWAKFDLSACRMGWEAGVEFCKHAYSSDKKGITKSCEEELKNMMDGTELDIINDNHRKEFKDDGFTRIIEANPMKGNVEDGKFKAFPTGTTAWFNAKYEIELWFKNLDNGQQEMMAMLGRIDE